MLSLLAYLSFFTIKIQHKMYLTETYIDSC